MDIITLINAISEFGVTLVICAFFFYSVWRMQKQDDKNEARIQESYKITLDICKEYRESIEKSQEKYFQSMNELTGKMTKFETKLDGMGEDIQELKKELHRGER